jgi:hypothetical protein
MSLPDFDPLKVYVLVSPFLVFGMALGVVWLAGWMDRRERRHHPAE